MKLKALLSLAAVLVFAIYFAGSSTAASPGAIPVVPLGVSTSGSLDVTQAIDVVWSNSGSYVKDDEIRIEVLDDLTSTLIYFEDHVDAQSGADDISANQLSSNTDYRLRMQASNKDGTSAFSSEYAFTTD